MSADELTTASTWDGQERCAFLSRAVPNLVGRIPWSSNATFLVELVDGEDSHHAVYKPVAGERPLHDFPPGLDRRELATYRLSGHLGLDVVPATVIRDGPLGPGSFQWVVDADGEHYFTLYQARPELHDTLRDIATLDLVANNTDRKSGHVLHEDGRVHAIDHGLCLSADFKVRTVIWDFAGDLVRADLLSKIAGLADAVPEDVAELLGADEVVALRQRCEAIVQRPVLPHDETGRRLPWPLV